MPELYETVPGRDIGDLRLVVGDRRIEYLLASPQVDTGARGECRSNRDRRWRRGFAEVAYRRDERAEQRDGHDQCQRTPHQRVTMATVSMWAVCGNMSTGCSDSMRYP